MDTLEPKTVRESLDADVMPEGVNEKDLDDAIREMSEMAHRRMIIDQCGGLPGPPIERQSLIRRLIVKLSGTSN